MNLGLTLEIVILSRHGSLAPYVTLALSCHHCAYLDHLALHLTYEILTMRIAARGVRAEGKAID